MENHLFSVLIIVLVLLVVSGLLSLAETAFTAANKARLLTLQHAGDKRAKRVGRLLQVRDRVVASLLLGNNVVNILATALTSSAFLIMFDEVGVFYATAVMTVLIVIYGEIMPKTYALLHPESSVLAFNRIIKFFYLILGPIARGCSLIAYLTLRLFGIKLGMDSPLVDPHDEIRGAVNLLHLEGGVEKIDKDMLGGLLDLKELTVSDIMIHRTKMNALDIDLPADQFITQALDSPHTRLPVWQGDPENIIGVLHIKSLVRALHGVDGDANAVVIAQIITPPWFIPDTTALGEQLRMFRKRKAHFALVVDEYGEVMGLVTLEDIIEEIVGDISDETDQDIQGVRILPGNIVIANGSVAIRDINRALDWNLPDEEATTLAGLVIHEARSIPELGQIFTFYGFKFEVIRRERNRITRLRITPTDKARRAPKALSLSA
ncbi:MAG: HlyC/CorC family transporter [Pseudomonadota bacterium]